VRELSLHILDIVENGITAGADCIHILIDEALAEDRLKIIIRDNGRGMPPEKLQNLEDPFLTSRKTRRVGLGLSLLATAAKRCQGNVLVTSSPRQGTKVVATFQHSHIDRAPLGDIASTLQTLIMGNPQIDFVYRHIVDGRDFMFDTREFREELKPLALNDPAVLQHLTKSVRTSIRELATSPDAGQQGAQTNGKTNYR
jgi:hypothetical protein